MVSRSRVIASVVAAIVVLSPLARHPTSDSYPLSTYPMFAADRGAVQRIATAVEVTPDGGVQRLSPELIAGSDEVILAAVTVERAITGGVADELCREVLDRLGPGRRVEIRRETVDIVDVVTDGAPPLAVEVEASCGG